MTRDAAPSPAPPRAWAALLLVILAAILVRGLYWSEVRHLSLFQEPTGDAATYAAQAARIRAEGLLAPAGEPYAQGPLYPFFLALFQSLGLGWGAVRAVQFLLGAAVAGCLWAVGRRLGGTRGGWVAGLGAALYGPFVFFEGELLSISLAVFLVSAALVLWGRRRGALAAGLALGLAALAQPNLFLGGLILAGTAVLRPRDLGWPGRRAAWILLAGLLVPVALTGVRNLSVSGEPVLISANGGVNFFIGNNAQADGTFHLPPDSGLLNRPEGLFTSAREVAAAARGGPAGVTATDRYWWLRGLDFWIGNPGHALGLFARKVLLALNDFEVPNHYDFGYFRTRAPVLRFLFTLGWLLPLGGVGLLLGWRRGWRAGPVLFGGILLSVALFFVTARYRLPLAVLLWPAAGLAADRLWAWRRAGARLVPALAAAGLYAVLAFVPLVHGGDTRAHMMNLEGTALLKKGDVPGATRAFEEALRARPDQPEALNNLGRIMMVQGKGAEAVGYFRRALAADPTQAETYLNLEEMYRGAGRHREALEILDRLAEARGGKLGDVAGPVAYRRGVNDFALGDTVRAVASLREAVAEDPDLAGAWLTLSVVDRKLGRTESAVQAAERAAALAPSSQEPFLVLGVALEDAGHDSSAAAALTRAVSLGPVDVETHYRLARLLLRMGRDAEAEGPLLAANKDKPYPPALLDLGRLYERLGRPDEARQVYQVLVRMQAPQAGEARRRLRALGPPPPDGKR